MNRLVIIGNGFDLAHSLPTKYSDFVNDFWKNFKDKCKTDEYKKLVSTNDGFDGYYLNYKVIENFNDIKENLIEYCKEYKYRFYESLIVAQHSSAEIFRFNNDFFRDICVKNSENWVDIENEYYRQLKKIVNSKCLDISKTEEYWQKEQLKQVENLNKEFEQIKNLLNEYLIHSIEKYFALKKYVKNL